MCSSFLKLSPKGTGGHFATLQDRSSDVISLGKLREQLNFQPVTNVMFIVAHPDDSLLFQGLSLIENIRGGSNCITVHLSAGDNGAPAEYWCEREKGIFAAYAHIAEVANHWSTWTLEIEDHIIAVSSLVDRPNVIVAFLRLPDGGFPAGRGSRAYQFHSLMKLWRSRQAAISTVDGTSSYSREDVIRTLVALMASFGTQHLIVQDYVATFGDGDHMDHYAVAQFAYAAHLAYFVPHTITGYRGYGTQSLPANVAGLALDRKQQAFYTYGRFDSLACSSAATCARTPYEKWLQREYEVGRETVGLVAHPGFSQKVSVAALVQLDGSRSSGQVGEVVAYSWEQVQGIPVVLTSSSDPRPTFVAPTTTGSLVFALRVMVGTLTSEPTRVTVSVVADDDGPPSPASLRDITSDQVSSAQ